MNSPRSGIVADVMRRARAKYHYANFSTLKPTNAQKCMKAYFDVKFTRKSIKMFMFIKLDCFTSKNFKMC